MNGFVVRKFDYLQSNVGFCSFCIFGRLNSDCEDDYFYYISYENIMRSGIYNRILDIL